MTSSWVLLARSGGDDELAALASCAASAEALGLEVRIVWDGAALRRRAEHDLASTTRRPDAETIFAAVGPGVRHFACSAAAGSQTAAGEPVGWPTVVGWIREAERVLSF
jgi:hypothetical protein